MSHFTVLVKYRGNIDDAEKKIKELLAPYQENNMNDCPKEYLVFEEDEEDHLKEYQTDGCDMVQAPDGVLLYTWDESFRKPKTFGSGSENFDIPAEFTRVHILHKDRFPTFEDFMRDWSGYKERDPETNKYGYWKNPNTKWDWYTVGGRWQGSLIVKSGIEEVQGELGVPNHNAEIKHSDIAYAKDLDLEAMREAEKKACVDKWQYYKETYRQEWFEEHCVKKYGGVEAYAEHAPPLVTSAVLEEGKGWAEKGEMGWFGVVKDEDYDWPEKFTETFLTEVPEDTVIAIVDCHI